MANLVFKFSWDHQPFPYNSAQGKRQFMLPFASGIPNLAPHYTQVQGLGTAAPLNTGRGLNNIPLVTDSLFAAEGRMVDEYKAQGTPLYPTLEAIPVGQRVLYFSPLVPDSPNLASAILCHVKTTTLFQETLGKLQNLHTYSTTPRHFFRAATTGAIGGWIEYRTTANTTVDANGFVKSASPIVKLFAESIELNAEAKKQPVEFEKLDVGNYLLKGSLGFAQEGWYIEVPKDANGNTVVAVEYSTLENGDLSIKTYKRKFEFELAAVVADHDNPMDIPEGRWIDIRLHEEPEPEPEIIPTETPMEFQPTNLSEAVAAAMNGVEPPEISDTDETL